MTLNRIYYICVVMGRKGIKSGSSKKVHLKESVYKSISIQHGAFFKAFL